ncbi:MULTISPECIES: formimidoylglutamate deiminase [Ramlibacter]|uniref:Formimidoylglutamate deiminase n=1 Tax=Ramlibacter pinisoli TaxID=2682844 RepID=A0A6N8J329_9BURK|nr:MULTISPECIES: formimidoylglutamate deiminase [Ramlibacter]MBA2962721.1 formimidoylglutamate deiminase [Ramlibacter sp. CGMCC 1.13660]MVQ32663.1 formimidoylglutamate deiminase [Ramlibacter pinisoli]
MPERLFARQAWIAGGWAHDVLLVAGADGLWSEVRPDCTAAGRAGAEVLDGAVLPALVDAHSHAFQRAIAGLTERSPVGEADDFWSWRDRMYQVALTVSPDDVERIATRLYRELLAGGYAHVCEFHYLHNDLDGRPYAEPAEMALALVRAAQAAGIGLTLLPTLYMRSGFGAAGLRDDQRRFASTPEGVLRIAEQVGRLGAGGQVLNAGIAIHSLRAVDPGALRETVDAARAAGMPIHLHIAEQQREVDDCVAQHGRRPIAWLLEQMPVDARWNLVHATHTVPQELHDLAATGASIVLCPTTEANLGDGVFDLPAWLQAGGRWSVGSDSQVARSWVEELRLLEYSQRLVRRQRNVAARAAGRESTAAVLLDGALAGGAAACGLAAPALRVGARAAFCVVDAPPPLVAGVAAPDPLDALLFASCATAPAVRFAGG